MLVMPQNVPVFEWTDNALQVRQFVYEFWCEHGVGPTLLDVHQATGLTRREIIQAYKELQLGIICVVDEDTQTLIAYKIYRAAAGAGITRMIWMDGRAHPPDYAAHTWQGFSTGKMEGDMLTITTTHLKAAFIRRNGTPRSDRSTVVGARFRMIRTSREADASVGRADRCSGRWTTCWTALTAT